MGIKDILNDVTEVIEGVGDVSEELHKSTGVGIPSGERNRKTQSREARYEERQRRSEVKIEEYKHEKERWEDHPDEHTIKVPDHGHTHPGSGGSSIIVDYESEVEYEGRGGRTRSRSESSREEIIIEEGDRDDVIYDRDDRYERDNDRRYESRSSRREEPSGDYRPSGNLSGSEALVRFHQAFDFDKLGEKEFNYRTRDIVDYLNETTGSEIEHAPMVDGSSAYSDMWKEIAKTIEKEHPEKVPALEAGAYGAWEEFSNEATVYLNDKYGAAEQQPVEQQPPSRQREEPSSDRDNESFKFTKNELNGDDIDRLYDEARSHSNDGNLMRLNSLVSNLTEMYPDSALAEQKRNGERASAEAVAESLNFFIQQYEENPTDRIISLKEGSLSDANALEHLSEQALRGKVQPYEMEYDQPESARQRQQQEAPERDNVPRVKDYDLRGEDIYPIYENLEREGRADELKPLVQDLAKLNGSFNEALKEEGLTPEQEDKYIAAAMQNFIERNYDNPEQVTNAIRNGDLDTFEDLARMADEKANGRSSRQSSVEVEETASQTVANAPDAQKENKQEETLVASAQTVAYSRPSADALGQVEANKSNEGRVTFEEGQAMFNAMAEQFGAENVKNALAEQGIFESPSNKAMMTEYMNSLGQERDPQAIADALGNPEIRAQALETQAQRQAEIAGSDEVPKDEKLEKVAQSLNFGDFAEGITYSFFDPSDTVSPLATQAEQKEVKGASIS